MQDDSASPSPFGGRRLWILIGGLIVLGVLLAGGGYWWLKHSHKQVGSANRPKLMGMLGDSVTALDTVLPAEDKICSTGLARAVEFGALPQSTTLVSADAKSGEPEGRLTCEAQGGGGKYVLNIDTTCPDGKDKTCFALDSIRGEDGSWLYKRRPYLAAPQG